MEDEKTEETEGMSTEEVRRGSGVVMTGTDHRNEQDEDETKIRDEDKDEQ